MFSIGEAPSSARSFAANPAGQVGNASPTPVPVEGDVEVTRLLEPVLRKHNMPAMAAAVLGSAGIRWSGVVGFRKRGVDVPARLKDLWHLGSDGKAMTAALAARMVENSQLKWTSSLGEVFSDRAERMHPEFRGVTLTQLLSHRSGLPRNLDLGRYQGPDVVALRIRAVDEELARKPLTPPGSSHAYSNLGYIIAGAMMERVTGASWEQLIRDQLFKPLKMEGAGFGGTGTMGEIRQPWPHASNGKPMPGNGPLVDNPPVMGPAGRIHSSLQDWARFIGDQLRGSRGNPGLLKSESYRVLQSPVQGGDYALGWVVAERSWADGKALHHVGDNTMNCANVWIAPARDFAVLVCLNQGGNAAFPASDDAVGSLIRGMGPELQQKRQSTGGLILAEARDVRDPASRVRQSVKGGPGGD